MAEKATKAAEEKAAEEGVDLDALEGSGKGGKVTVADVEEAASTPQADLPDTPSGLALKEVGPDGDGEEYAKIKAKHRWGYPD